MTEPVRQPFRSKDIVGDSHICPLCATEIPIGCMSLCCTCEKCGTFYADVSERRGWYRSKEAYYAGDAALKEGQ